jgi:hypothetical protein
MVHLVLSPDQGQRPGQHHGDQQQDANRRERKPDVVLAVEQNPRRDGEPGDKADRGSVKAG